jgi:ATP-binding cassette, subfamily C, bacterial CydC
VSALWRILQLWRGRTPWLALGIVVSLLALATAVALMTVAGGLAAGLLTGAVLGTPLSLRLLGPPRVVLRYLERLTTHDATFRALADLRVWFFRGLAVRSAGGLGFRRAGDVLARLVNDVEALDGIYLRIALPLAGAALLLPVLLIVIGHTDPLAAVLIALLFVASAFLLPALAARAGVDSGARLSLAGSALRVACLDPLHGLREVRAFSAEGRMLANVQAREAVLFAVQRDLARRGALAGAGAFLCAQAGILVALLAAGTHPAQAILIAFLTVAAFEAVSGLSRAGVAAGQAVSAARRVVDAAEGPPAVAELPATQKLPQGNTLKFEAVTFAWASDRPPVFEGLTLEVPQGSRVALLGPSGVGKSTLAALALKVVTPQSGRVLLGGVDIATLAADDVRSRIGWLSQATHLFDDTIAANLRLARPDADDAALWAALDAAQLGDVVRALPDKLDAWVGEGGAQLSGGQGRRLALARALLSTAPVLILDEPCAGLDAETERAFFATLNEVAEERSVVLIAHRLTGVERLDRIFRLSGGRAVAAAG